MCVCFCGYFYIPISVFYRIPQHLNHKQFPCGLLLHTLFSTFIFLVFCFRSFYFCYVRFQWQNDFGFHISHIGNYFWWSFHYVYVYWFKIGISLCLSVCECCMNGWNFFSPLIYSSYLCLFEFESWIGKSERSFCCVGKNKRNFRARKATYNDGNGSSSHNDAEDIHQDKGNSIFLPFLSLSHFSFYCWV